MDNGASSYYRFLAGDDEGLHEIICEYRTGLILYLKFIIGEIGLDKSNIPYEFEKLPVLMGFDLDDMLMRSFWCYKRRAAAPFFASQMNKRRIFCRVPCYFYAFVL